MKQKISMLILTCVCLHSALSAAVSSPEATQKEQTPSTGLDNGQKSQTPSTNMETYVNKEKKYSLEYPSDWQKKDVQKLDIVLLSPAKSPTTPTHATMNAISEAVGPVITLDEFYKESVSNLSSQLKDIHIESSGDASLNGTPSKWVLYSHEMQGTKFKVLQYFIVAQENVYLLTFSALADDFDSFRPTFNKIASSFRLIKDQLTSHDKQE